MCGIVGVLNFGVPVVEGIDKHRESALFFGVTLLELSESRGKNATGIVSTFDDSMYVGQKMGISAIDFIARFGGKKEDFDSFTKVTREYNSGLRTIIGHCRKNSVGNSFDNANNHPIRTGNILGVHNGTLNNHEEVFNNLKCKKDGDVDSEAIMRLLEFYTEKGSNPFTTDMLYETGSRLNGSFSVLAVNTDNPNQAISMKDGRPAEYCLIKPLNMVLIASEKKFFERAIWEYNKAGNLFGHSGFITLKINDVEFASLVDESVALFDLTKEITSETKIIDLYDTKRLPITSARLWKHAVKITAYNRNVQHSSVKTTNSFNGAREYTPTNKPARKKWDRELGIFVNDDSSTDKDISKISLGKKNDCPEDNQVVHEELAIVNFKNEDYDNIMPVAEVKEYKISDIDKKPTFTEKEIKETKEKNRIEILDKIKQQAKDGKNTTQHFRDAQTAAILSTKSLEKFKSAEDVSIACDIDINSLKKLDVPAIANRILKSVFSSTFKQGWLAKCDELDEISNSKQVKKSTSAEKTIRVLKTIVNGLNTEFYNKIPATTINCIHKFVKKLPSNTEINEKNIQRAFNTNELEEGIAHEVINALIK